MFTWSEKKEFKSWIFDKIERFLGLVFKSDWGYFSGKLELGEFVLF